MSNPIPEQQAIMDKEGGFCKDCSCKPCQCKQLAHARKYGAKKCISCGTHLFLRGGYGGTDLCGPCCTGESETLEEAGEEW